MPQNVSGAENRQCIGKEYLIANWAKRKSYTDIAVIFYLWGRQPISIKSSDERWMSVIKLFFICWTFGLKKISCTHIANGHTHSDLCNFNTIKINRLILMKFWWAAKLSNIITVSFPCGKHPAVVKEEKTIFEHKMYIVTTKS